MPSARIRFLFVVAMIVAGQALEAADPPLRIVPTPSLVAFAKDLVGPLHSEGIDVKIMPPGGNAVAIEELGSGAVEAALLTRPIKVDERVDFPQHHFVESTLGVHAVAVVASRLVWDGGVRALTRDQIANLYENKFRNWKAVGGEDRPLQFFEPAHDRGPWEIFVTWLYGDTRKAPGVPWQIVSDGGDTRTALQFSSGGLSVASLRWIDRRDVFPISIIGDSGKPIEPTVANVASGVYPLVRPVIIAFAEEPVTRLKKMAEFLISEKGQELVEDHDVIPQNQLKK